MSEEKVTYYAITGRGHTVDNPRGLLRRRESPELGLCDEGLDKNFIWQPTGVIVTWENASYGDELEEVSEEKANEIVEDLRTEFG